MIAPADWLSNLREIYVRNAGATRDYRAQLRGGRGVLLAAIYLGFLILVSTVFYLSIAADGPRPAAGIQQQLQIFYLFVMGTLSAIMALVAPALMVTSIVGEHQKRTIDLIFSAPVDLRYFLVGKLVSGYRNVWMLLVLSLPITASCVVMGGATGWEVLVSYAIISLHGLLYMGIAAPIAVINRKTVPGVMWSYAAVGALTFVVGIIPAAGFGSIFGSGGTGEAPFALLLSPIWASIASSTYTTLPPYGWQIPNWILAGLTILLIVKICLLAAGAVYGRVGAYEIKSLRVHGVLYAFLAAWFVSASLSPIFTSIAGSGMGGGPNVEQVLAGVAFGISTFLALPLSHLSTYSFRGDRKYLPDGLFSWRGIWKGTPSGGLPTLLMVLAAIILGVVVSLVGPSGAGFFAQSLGLLFATYVLWIFGFWFFCWSIGWLVSSFVRTGPEAARRSTVAAIILIFLSPIPVLNMVAQVAQERGIEVWWFYPVSALGRTDIPMILVNAGLLWGVGLVLTIFAEKRRKAEIQRREDWWKALP